MATISTYVSGHTEAEDIAEFFQKQLLNAGERPIAFFDGVFYESHQERVGNIAYQDYLIYSDRAVYLWARGANKDYLDRFALGAVSINSRNKDNDFATLNLRIRREDKEAVYVIFDMVEIDEAEKISTLHTVIETIIEKYLGDNFRNEIPDEIAEQIVISAANICPPAPLSFKPSAGQAPGPEQNSRIGYGQDLLEQYKASMGYPPDRGTEAGQQHGASFADNTPRQHSPGSQRPVMPGIPKELEGLLPTDPEALKRIAGNLKDMVGDAPFKFRDQVMKDLQHVPNDLATMLTAVNELIVNIADNPKAEKFVMNAIQTAVKNDGILGSMGKMLKLTTSFGPMGKKSGGQQPPARSAEGARSGESDTGEPPLPNKDGSGSIRRKKVKIQADGDDPVADISMKSLDQVLHDIESDMPSGSSDLAAGRNEGGVEPKKIKIVTDEPEVTQSGSSTGDVHQESPAADVFLPDDQSDSTVHAGKIKMKAEDDIPPAVEEQLREALQEAEDLGQSEPGMIEEEHESEVVRKKISIQNEEVGNSQAEKSKPGVYRTMESESRQEDGAGSGSSTPRKKAVTNSGSRVPLDKSKQ